MSKRCAAIGGLLGLALLWPTVAWADGKLVAPADYTGSLEEQAQEAIIIFQPGEKQGEAVEDLILKISVRGAADRFAWVVPLPNEPQTAKEDAQLFRELFDYVAWRTARPHKSEGVTKAAPAAAKPAAETPVEVLSRKIVGVFDVAVVREHEAGALNQWLAREGYQTLPDADDVLKFYRDKRYVLACVKVSDAALAGDAAVELHPLRFTFKTGGRDGIYFPMKLTGLQTAAFDVNLYIFYEKWINDHLSKYGYENRGFRRKYRDWDTPQCEPNAGKNWSAPQHDPFLSDYAGRLPTIVALMQKLHPGQPYYLTNIQAGPLKPADVRAWSDDLWLFPYYTDRKFVPFDARPGGPAAAAWPSTADGEQPLSAEVQVYDLPAPPTWVWPLGAGLVLVGLGAVGWVILHRRRPV